MTLFKLLNSKGFLQGWLSFRCRSAILSQIQVKGLFLEEEKHYKAEKKLLE